jgi:hypothetical protein
VSGPETEPVLRWPEDFAEAAREYSRLGWALSRAAGKRPKGKRWQTAKPVEPEFAAGQWATWGRTENIGVVLGPSGLVEFDAADAADTLLELFGGELPDTPTSRSGSGRLQWFFVDAGHPHGARNGIELRTGAHFHVLPPSVHPTGEPYRWEDGHAPWEITLATVPAAVVDYFASRPNGAGHPAPAGGAIPEKQRHINLVRIAGAMRRHGLTGDEILAALVRVNERCDPRLQLEELRELAEDIGHRYQPAAPLEPATSAAESASWQPVNLAVLPDRDAVRPTLGQLGLFYPGKRHLSSGPQESAKTTVACIDALAELRNGNVVVHIDLEMGRYEARDRYRDLGATDEELARLIYLEPETPPD